MRLSVVTSLYHSQAFIKDFYQRMVAVLKAITPDYEIIFVNDGSPDRSTEIVLEIQSTDPSIVLIDLSRNFGHHKALLTGLKYATGDYIFLIDSDLEEDPEMLISFWEEMKLTKDVDVIYGIQGRRKGSWFERMSGSWYYSFFTMLSTSKYPVNTVTARLMTRRYIEALKEFGEKEADLWGLFMLNGFEQKSIIVSKKHKGSSTYSIRRRLSMAIDTISTLTHRPLYLVIVAGILALLFSFASGLYLLYDYINYRILDTYLALVTTIWFVGGLILLCLGVISIYLSKMFLEVKNRPVSIIKKIYSKQHGKNESD